MQVKHIFPIPAMNKFKSHPTYGSSILQPSQSGRRNPSSITGKGDWVTEGFSYILLCWAVNPGRDCRELTDTVLQMQDMLEDSLIKAVLLCSTIDI